MLSYFVTLGGEICLTIGPEARFPSGVRNMQHAARVSCFCVVVHRGTHNRLELSSPPERVLTSLSVFVFFVGRLYAPALMSPGSHNRRCKSVLAARLRVVQREAERSTSACARLGLELRLLTALLVATT